MRPELNDALITCINYCSRSEFILNIYLTTSIASIAERFKNTFGSYPPENSKSKNIWNYIDSTGTMKMQEIQTCVISYDNFVLLSSQNNCEHNLENIIMTIFLEKVLKMCR